MRAVITGMEVNRHLHVQSPDQREMLVGILSTIAGSPSTHPHCPPLLSAEFPCPEALHLQSERRPVAITPS